MEIQFSFRNQINSVVFISTDIIISYITMVCTRRFIETHLFLFFSYDLDCNFSKFVQPISILSIVIWSFLEFNENKQAGPIALTANTYILYAQRMLFEQCQ